MKEPHYELYDWERKFRDILFGDLKVVKFILDEDTTTYACRNLDKIRPVCYGDSLDRFWKDNQRHMTFQEASKFWQQVRELVKRVEALSVREAAQR